jgi:DNA-binding transcriptional regulator YbjK
MTIPGLTRGEQTRQAILQVVRDLLVKLGYRGISMRQTAREADIAPGATAEFQQDAMHYFVDIYLHGILTATQ